MKHHVASRWLRLRLRLLVWVAFIVGMAAGVFGYVQAGYEREAAVVAQSQQTALSVASHATASMHQLELETRLRTDVLTPPVLALWARASQAA
ncbi:MAG: hypothetical protein U1A81_14255, partial [Hydrogenophaga sp.]|nr:hypothetical protein [Hydrogenophaga sp.]